MMLTALNRISRNGSFVSCLCGNIGQGLSNEIIGLSSSVRHSSNKKLKEKPVNPNILRYIENIGVGISKRRSLVKNKRRKSRGILTDEEETEFFQQTKQLASSCRPPPPFAAPPSKQDINIKRHPVKVLGRVGAPDDKFPKQTKDFAEIAVAGRSNVGKSTLLNALLYGNTSNAALSKDDKTQTRRGGRVPENVKLPRGIKASVSATPGETKHITFYKLASTITTPDSTSQLLTLWLVDLPGYGFAYAKPEKAEVWKNLMQSYLINRGKPLKRILLLIDARHGMKKADTDFLASLESIVYNNSTEQKDIPPIQIVLTKCDLVKQPDLARRVVQVREELLNALRREPSSLPVMLVSAKPGVGFNNMKGNRALGGVLELQRELAALAPNHTVNFVPAEEVTSRNSKRAR